ncbi:rubredoxin [Sphingobacterium haloxyli]|uniref:Rubredoxin n=1 Tax=Sphingobacterium haloxyli TaxID=2100533 RepID=A0A2S9J858_9SPHI|nr:rubredoxin [Sphingobacterium haloxyli]PRD48968.1 rubredoxin [Sphingobacterium haloxyli]
MIDHEKSEQQQRVKVNLSGGFVSVGDFKVLLEAIDAAGIRKVKIGTRQQLLFSASPVQIEELAYDFFNQELLHEVNDTRYPNIVSSYVADGIYNQPNWLREGIYKDILASFTATPKFKINIVDATQSLVPYYTGNLNFVSSEIGNYWHLYIRWPKTNQIYTWSSLVYSLDIAPISEELETAILGKKEVSEEEITGICTTLEASMTASKQFLFQEQASPLVESEFRLPYYEGFNRYDDKYWLGIYQPDESYRVSFLLDVCKICQTTRVGQLYTTPWRSLIIKDIHQEDRKEWDSILDKHRINLRHASNQLNWQIEDWCEPALKLKRSIVRYFDRWNIRTYRLSFGIKIGSNSGIWGSIIIKSTGEESNGGVFDVFHTKDFNANSHTLVPYQRGISGKVLPGTLKTLCDHFYDLTPHNTDMPDEQAVVALPEPTHGAQESLFQCSHCLSVYDPFYGDLLASIKPGTEFANLPVDYTCGLCDSPKKDFRPINKISTTT